MIPPSMTPAPDDADRLRWGRIGRRLVAATAAYNVVEAVVALWAGAEAESIALLGFGFDSVIEFSAAMALFWRLRVEARGMPAEAVERAERRVGRFVGVTFLLLALYVLAEAALTLWRREPPSETLVGIALATASLAIMPGLAWGKLRAAARVGSAALRAEAKETLACAYLSFALLVGLGANALAGWWWADPAAALLMVPWLVREGIEGLQGEGCACAKG